MSRLDDLFSLFDRFGDRAYGEDVTQREHARQVAHCASAAGERDAIVVAALLHDIGQLLDGAGDAAARERRDARHEITGAAFLEGLFPEEVLAPIRLHVAAKRYLCAIEPAYLPTLSDASMLSLNLQGGAFSASEAKDFERLPFAAEATRLRRYDDAGKQIGVSVAPLNSYRGMIETVASCATGRS